MSPFKKLFFTVALLSVLCLGLPASATLLAPTIIIIDPDQRTATLNIKNTSTKETHLYKFEWRPLTMNEKGGLSFIDEEHPAENLKKLEPHIRFSPRRLVLAPGQAQKIRFLVRRTKDMEQGEYRGHFYVIQQSAPAPGTDGDDAQTAIGIEFNLNKSIPVYMRHGEQTLDISLADAKRVKDEDGKDAVQVTINRSGTASALGILRALCTSNGEEVVLFERPRTIYHETPYIKRVEPYTPPAGGCTDMRLEYVGSKDDKFYSDVIHAQTTVQ